MGESRYFQRLDQIVERVRLKRAHGEFIVGSHKYQEWHGLRANFFNDIKAIQVWHLHVEKYEVWLQFAQCTDGLASVSGLCNHGNIFVRCEQLTYPTTCKWFIVSNDCTYLKHRLVSAMESAPLPQFHGRFRC